MSVALTEIELAALFGALVVAIVVAAVAWAGWRSAVRRYRAAEERGLRATVLGEDPIAFRLHGLDLRLAEIGSAQRRLGLR